MNPAAPKPLESWRLFFPLAALLGVGGLVAWASQLAGQPVGLRPADHGAYMIWGVMGAGVQGFLFTAYARQNDAPLPGRRHLLLQAGLQVGAAALLLGLDAPAPLVAMGVLAPWLLLTGWTVRVAVPSLRRRWDATTAAVPAVLVSGLAGVGLHLAGATAPRGVDVGVHAFLVPLALAVLDRVLPFFSSRVTPGYTGARRPWFLGPLLLLAWMGLLVPAALPATALGSALLLARQAAGWRPWPAARTPAIAVLHLGVAWFALGWLLAAAGAPRSAVLHALVVGGMGTLLLAISMRVVQGHSGLPIALGRVGLGVLVAAQIAAVARVLVGVGAPGGLLVPSALVLAGAFLGWLLRFGPTCRRAGAEG